MEKTLGTPEKLLPRLMSGALRAQGVAAG